MRYGPGNGAGRGAGRDHPGQSGLVVAGSAGEWGNGGMGEWEDDRVDAQLVLYPVRHSIVS